MKKFTAIIALFVVMTSCSKQFIQVFDVATTNTQLKDGSYVFENDTLKITYSFWASKGVMSFSVYNKLNKPLYIDWGNSSMIYNDHTHSYWTYKEPASIASQYNSVYFYKYHLIDFRFNNPNPSSSATERKCERITFIPPKSLYNKTKFCLLPVDFYEINLNSQPSVVSRNDKDKKKTTVYGEEFSAGNSPLKFRNHIAYSTSENTDQLSSVDHSFYLSSVKEMDLRHYLGKATGYDNNYNFIFSQVFRKNTSFYINIPTEKNIPNRKINQKKMQAVSAASTP